LISGGTQLLRYAALLLVREDTLTLFLSIGPGL
jgi:hypothetical protein